MKRIWPYPAGWPAPMFGWGWNQIGLAGGASRHRRRGERQAAVRPLADSQGFKVRPARRAPLVPRAWRRGRSGRAHGIGAGGNAYARRGGKEMGCLPTPSGIPVLRTEIHLYAGLSRLAVLAAAGGFSMASSGVSARPLSTWAGSPGRWGCKHPRRSRGRDSRPARRRTRRCRSGSSGTPGRCRGATGAWPC